MAASVTPAAAQSAPAIDTGALDLWEEVDGRLVPVDHVYALPNAAGPLIDTGGFELFEGATPVRFVYDARDGSAPLLAAPTDLSVECSGPGGQAVALGTPSVSDLRDSAPVVTHDAPPRFGLGTTPVTWRAEDFSGNVASAVQQVTVQDTTPPAVVAPPDLTVECSDPAGTPVLLGQATASDLCDPAPVVAHDAPAAFLPGLTLVTWTARDAGGNQATAVQRVVIEDTTPPSVTPPAALTLASPPGQDLLLGDPELGAWLAGATASDRCDPAPTIRHDAPLRLAVGASALVTFTASDAAGNTASAQAALSVVPQQVTIHGPAPDSCGPGPVVLSYSHNGDLAEIDGTRTVGGSALPAGPGPTYALHGVYDLHVSSSTVRGTVSAGVRFSLDTVGPAIAIHTPELVPRPGQEPSSYRVSPDPETHDLPLPVEVSVDDEDGVPGGVASTQLFLDGVPWEHSSERALDALGSVWKSPLPGGHALRIDGLPGPDAYRWDPEDRASWHRFPDGRALLRGRLVQAGHHERQWELELWFAPAAPPNNGPRLELHADHYLPEGPIDPAGWETLELDPVRSNLRGRVAWAGRALRVLPAPGGQLQVGLGANGRSFARGLSGLFELEEDRPQGVRRARASLNVELHPTERVITRGVLAALGLPALGRHVLEVRARDACAGNETVATRPFELALFAKWGLLWVSPSSLHDPGKSLLIAVSFVPPLPTDGPLGPTTADVVASTLQLEDLGTGRAVAPDVVEFDPILGVLTTIYRKDALRAPDGSLGPRFRLTGRFFGEDGPRFVATAEVR